MRKDREASREVPDARGLSFALVVSRFNDFVTDRLQDGALGALASAGVSTDEVSVLSVPGSFELPLAARCVAETKRFDAVICLGCLIRGATSHFEYIASAVSSGIIHASAETRVPISFGVLTTNSVEEALERAGQGPSNKGREAAIAAIEMAILLRELVRSCKDESPA
jgi:6,7-dimethyl-8-ribityllumazine synthase